MTGLRRPLSRELVLKTALRLADRHGTQAMSMRKLGAALGVEAMSIYHHVRSREDLLDGLAEIMVRDELPVPKPSDPWEEALRDFLVGIRHTALRHPAAFELVGLRPLRSPAALAPVEALLLCLHQGGLTPNEAVAAYRTGTAYARGFALAELVGLTLADRRGPVTIPPTLAAFVPALTGDSAEIFHRGIELIIGGIRQSLSEEKVPEG